MNKQELIKHIRALPYSKGPLKDTAEVNIGWLIRTIDQLDEPEKAKVPQFVADWIEVCKTFKHFVVSLSFALQPIAWEKNNLSDKCINWLMDANNQETFARAWLDGYEVEEEKKYFVKLKAVDQYLVSVKDENFLGFLQSRLRSKFTRKELEDANLGWVFSCEGVEVEEVE